jgi:uncharacterized protein YndB with AHSA1/START domain
VGHIEASKHLDASPEAVFSVIADLSGWDTWFGVHDKWLETPPATPAVGNKLLAKVVMLGMANKIDWTVTDYETPSLLALTGTGMAGVQCSFRFSVAPDGDGANVSVTGDFEGALIKGALGKAVEKDGIKQLGLALEKLQARATAAV